MQRYLNDRSSKHIQVSKCFYLYENCVHFFVSQELIDDNTLQMCFNSFYFRLQNATKIQNAQGVKTPFNSFRSSINMLDKRQKVSIGLNKISTTIRKQLSAKTCASDKAFNDCKKSIGSEILNPKPETNFRFHIHSFGAKANKNTHICL